MRLFNCNIDCYIIPGLFTLNFSRLAKKMIKRNAIIKLHNEGKSNPETVNLLNAFWIFGFFK